MPATNAQLRPGGEVLRKQVKQAWNVLCIFFHRTSTKVLAMLEASPICHPRDPFQPQLWNILHNNYEELKANYDESYQKQYGFFRFVSDFLSAYHCGPGSSSSSLNASRTSVSTCLSYSTFCAFPRVLTVVFDVGTLTKQAHTISPLA
jgi:hypothetical protein